MYTHFKYKFSHFVRFSDIQIISQKFLAINQAVAQLSSFLLWTLHMTYCTYIHHTYNIYYINIQCYCTNTVRSDGFLIILIRTVVYHSPHKVYLQYVRKSTLLYYRQNKQTKQRNIRKRNTVL